MIYMPKHFRTSLSCPHKKCHILTSWFVFWTPAITCVFGRLLPVTWSWSHVSFVFVQAIETFLSKDISYVISASAPSRSSSQTRGQGQGELLEPESPSFAGSLSPFSATPSPTYKNRDGKIVPVRGFFYLWASLVAENVSNFIHFQIRLYKYFIIIFIILSSFFRSPVTTLGDQQWWWTKLSSADRLYIIIN